MGQVLDGGDHPGCNSLPPLKDLRLMLSSHAAHDLPSGPPSHVLAEVDAAWERAQDLFAGELELGFALDSFTRRVSGELRVPGGDVWERVSAGEALAIACGDVAVLPVASSVLAA
jgi:hypothetical protein